MGVNSECARQIVRKYERYLESLEDPFQIKIIELGHLGDATRILNALRGNEFYDGDPEKLVNYKPEDLKKIRKLGVKSIGLIAKALESVGLIGECRG